MLGRVTRPGSSIGIDRLVKREQKQGLYFGEEKRHIPKRDKKQPCHEE